MPRHKDNALGHWFDSRPAIFEDHKMASPSTRKTKPEITCLCSCKAPSASTYPSNPLFFTPYTNSSFCVLHRYLKICLTAFQCAHPGLSKNWPTIDMANAILGCVPIMAVTNNMFLLFFFDMRLPYAFHLTYLNTSLLAGIHESSNTCLNMCLPHGKHALASHLPHAKHAVYACLFYLSLLFKPVVSSCNSLALH
jgi:hypothetical protein